MNMHQLTKYAIDKLHESYNETEVQSLCKIIFACVLGYTNIEIHLKKYELLDESFSENFLRIISRLQQNEPLQYILGSCEFLGTRFEVNRYTLIPRPETEELVMWAQENIPPNGRILDIGCGSGCIAVSIGKHNRDCSVDAVDISNEALSVAQKNALNNNVYNVTFRQCDILNHKQYQWQYYDCIISNPPYVRTSEKMQMHSRVKDFEPASALFVDDSNPLLFYDAISDFALKYLNTGGELYFEINEALGNETVKLLENKGFHNVELKKDINEKDRFVKGIL
ncbi:MAG: peptide chain release factor N(5)-glutamine methyltransferase [Culturomica sp.]|jgi:release factor glutamine methyltransferase|nr:peptide chain release factor N(5)-glutamine methyltransferase [Culturomica sp.]